MFGVDPKRATVAEHCREVINGKTQCWQFATVKRVFYFIEIIKTTKHQHKRGMV